MHKIPIDLMDGPQFALRGRIVTMNKTRDVIDDGVMYVDKGRIAAIAPHGAAAPEGFKDVAIINTRSTIYPGLIELHNHLSYNILKLWNVPATYTNRNQWAGIKEYRRLISGPMNVLGRTPGCVEAVVRFVECKCLMAGVTTSQGIALFSNSGIQKYYRGVVRNVENTDDADLPESLDKISDVEAHSAAKFFERLKRQSCLLLHLCEGTDENAHKHFTDLQLKNGHWAITDALAGIHCVALNEEDYKIMKQARASVVWSPLSNLLLYGKTADVKAAVKNDITIGLGSDWSPSGSKNLFGECKVARLVSREMGIFDNDSDILALATIEAAKILKWDHELGSIEAGKRADCMLMTGVTGDPYQQFLTRSEAAISLVIINGIPRYGYASLMKKFEKEKEDITVGKRKYQLFLQQSSADAAVGALGLQAAVDKLTDSLERLPELAKELDNRGFNPISTGIANTKPQWFLVLDHDDEAEGERLRMQGEESLDTSAMLAPAEPLSAIVEKMDLDAITVAADRSFLSSLQSQRNLPAYVKKGLAQMYR
ncbi:MAG TPA: amidohydrolase family protein [Chitinophagaceae bacterium]|nr:amidohydrolase family protein [Chitinophagaceae bacterium]